MIGFRCAKGADEVSFEASAVSSAGFVEENKWKKRNEHCQNNYTEQRTSISRTGSTNL